MTNPINIQRTGEQINSPVLTLTSNLGSYREFNGPQTFIRLFLAEGNLNSPGSISDKLFQRGFLINPQTCLMTYPLLEGTNKHPSIAESVKLIGNAIDSIHQERPPIDYIYMIINGEDSELVNAMFGAMFRFARSFSPPEIRVIENNHLIVPKPLSYNRYSLMSHLVEK
jgi:hypothetical protein